MNNLNNKIIITLIMLVVVIAGFSSNAIFAATEAEKAELIGLLNDYKDNLGDLKEVEEIINGVYNDLNSATTVDEELKGKLSERINEIENVTGIDPIIAQTLKIELLSQIESLDDSNIGEVKEEMEVIKEWLDYTIANSSNNNVNNNPNNNTNVENIVGNNNYANMTLPKAGTISTIVIVSIVAILIACAVVSIMKYGKFKDIK